MSLPDFFDLRASSKCVLTSYRLDGFHVAWLMQIIMMPACFLGAGLISFCVTRSRTSKDIALAQFTGQAFVVLFFIYPQICAYAFNTLACRTVQLQPNKVSVLIADDRILCEDDQHVLFERLSYIVIGVIAIGVPVGSALVLYREKQRQPLVNPMLKLRAAEAFGVSTAEAAVVVNEIRLGSKVRTLAVYTAMD